MAYSDPPERNIVRLIVTSAYSIGRAPSELSMVSDTSALPSGGRPEVAAKMTSSLFPPRSDFAPCSPITQASASTTFDLPEPLGPTTQVMPGSRRSVVAEAKDLKPRSVRLFRYTGGSSHDRCLLRQVVNVRNGLSRGMDRQRRICRAVAVGKTGASSLPKPLPG